MCNHLERTLIADDSATKNEEGPVHIESGPSFPHLPGFPLQLECLRGAIPFRLGLPYSVLAE